jgi:hypothetical protein
VRRWRDTEKASGSKFCDWVWDERKSLCKGNESFTLITGGELNPEL